MMVYRKVIQDIFQMDINHFLGIPGLSFNLMLKISKVKLELASDPEISILSRFLCFHRELFTYVAVNEPSVQRISSSCHIENS